MAQFYPISCHVPPLPPKYHLPYPILFLCTLFSNSLRLCSSPYQIHSHITEHPKVYSAYFINFTFFNRQWEDKRFWTKYQQAFLKFNVPLITSYNHNINIPIILFTPKFCFPRITPTRISHAPLYAAN